MPATDKRRTRGFPYPLARLTTCFLSIAAVVLGPSRGLAQDVKELMGRAQTQAEQKAVEELVRKLQGRSPTRPAPAAPTSETPAAKSEPESQVASPAQTEPTPQVTTPAKVDPEPQVSMPAAPPQETTPSSQPAIATPRPDATPEITLETGAPQPPEPAPKISRPAPIPPAPAANPQESTPQPAQPPRPSEVARPVELPSVDIEVYFDVDSDVITARAQSTLMVLARALTDPRLATAKFLIGGHTDATGDPGYNLRLSARRAESVRRFLIATFGISEDRLVSRGFGQQQLKFPRRPTALENRRVQIVNLSAQLAR